jgi:pyruvate dehydrogenase E2 component (dihydrolipoamide acetyltransferase)
MWGEARSPQVLGFDDIDFTEINRLCDQLRAEHGVAITPTHFAVRATAEAFKRYPDLNVLMVRGKPMRRKDVSIFVQVAVTGGSAGGADLSGIKIKNADQKNVLEIAQELAGRAKRVRKGQDKDIESTKKLFDVIPGFVLGGLMGVMDKLMFDLELDLSGMGVKPDPFGSAMITNCSGFGVHAGFAPLVPMSRTPVIFLIGRTDDKPVVRDGEVVVRPICRSTGTFDHRLLDGYQIGLICDAFKEFMEDPTCMEGALP